MTSISISIFVKSYYKMGKKLVVKDVSFDSIINESKIDSVIDEPCNGGNYSIKGDTITYWYYYPYLLRWSAEKWTFKVIDKNTLLLLGYSPSTEEGDEFPRYYSDTLTTILSYHPMIFVG